MLDGLRLSSAPDDHSPDVPSNSPRFDGAGAFDMSVGNEEKTCADRPYAALVVSSGSVAVLNVVEAGSSTSAPIVQRVVVLMGPA